MPLKFIKCFPANSVSDNDSATQASLFAGMAQAFAPGTPRTAVLRAWNYPQPAVFTHRASLWIIPWGSLAGLRVPRGDEPATMLVPTAAHSTRICVSPGWCRVSILLFGSGEAVGGFHLHCAECGNYFLRGTI